MFDQPAQQVRAKKIRDELIRPRRRAPCMLPGSRENSASAERGHYPDISAAGSDVVWVAGRPMMSPDRTYVAGPQVLPVLSKNPTSDGAVPPPKFPSPKPTCAQPQA